MGEAEVKERVAQAVIVDWGTTSFRAFLTAEDGQILSAIETDQGISGLSADSFELVLSRNLAEWFKVHGSLPVACLGMITSRSGWVELPYVPCPANVDDLARAVRRLELANGVRLTFLAGLTDPARRPFPDVMRGEETQIVGFGLSPDATIVLPGTHSKWARVRGGRIEGFQTFVTGEIFALLTKHSFIARAAGAPLAVPDWVAFDRGSVAAAEGRSEAFLSSLFSARTGMLAGELGSSAITDYVSGLVIGEEFREARAEGWLEPEGAIGIVGNDGLNERYARAARTFGLDVVDGGEEAAIRGALAILRAAEEFHDAL